MNDIYKSNDAVFAKAATLAAAARGVMQAVNNRPGGRRMETFLTEYNIQATWKPLERRHGNIVGAVFQASVVRRTALEGVTGILQWHVKGNVYGMIAADNTMRPTAWLYRWGTQHLVGNIAVAQTEDENNLEILPVIKPGVRRSLLLINKANRTVLIPHWITTLTPRKHPPAELWRLDATTADGPVRITSNTNLTLPGYSLTLATF
jgi:hypothetical protein